MEDVFSPELNVSTPPCSTLRAPPRPSFGDRAARGTFSSPPENLTSAAHAAPFVHQFVLLPQQSGCMHPSPPASAAPPDDPLRLPTDRGASLRSLQSQLPSALPLERIACNFAAQQHACAHNSVLPASHVHYAARARTSPIGVGLLSSPCFTSSSSAPPPYPPSTPLPNHPKITADQQYDCAHLSVLSASNGWCVVRARTSPLEEGLLSFPCSTCSSLAPTPCPPSTPRPNQSNLHGSMGSVQSDCCSTSAPFSTAMASPVQGGPRAGVPVAAAVCVTLSPPPPLDSSAGTYPIASPAPPRPVAICSYAWSICRLARGVAPHAYYSNTSLLP